MQNASIVGSGRVAPRERIGMQEMYMSEWILKIVEIKPVEFQGYL